VIYAAIIERNQQAITFAELAREFPELQRPRDGARIPDPWDDYGRSDLGHHCWKPHRKTQYRIKPPARIAQLRLRVTYDTPWVVDYRHWFRGDGARFRYRVRLKYQRQQL
jgi:hypothetical protein